MSRTPGQAPSPSRCPAHGSPAPALTLAPVARARGGVLWIAISGILLAGVVFVNVAVLRLNLALDSTNAERVKLHAQDAALQSQLSSTLASPRIQSLAAKQFGLVYADPSQYGYVNLAH